MTFDDFDLQTQEQNLAQRKAVIDALAARAAQGSTIGDGVRSLLGFAPRDGSVEMQSYARDNAAFQAKKQAQMQGELGQYMSGMQGVPARPASPDSNGNAYGPDVPGQAPNPRQAVIQAMTSQLPEIQGIGKASFAALNKPPEYAFHAAGDTLYKENKQTGEAVPVATAPKARWVDEDKVINGQTVPGQRNQMDGQWMPKAPAGTTVNVDTKGQTEVQKDALAAMKSSRDQVISAQTQLEAAQRVLSLVDDPSVQTGFGAGAVNGIAAIGTKLGLNGPEGVAKTQALMTDLARNTLNAGQQMKGSFSDKDIQFLSDVTAGKVDYNPLTLKHMASLAFAAGHNQMLMAHDQYNGSATIPGLENATKVYPLPEARWDATIARRPGFVQSDNGRLQYKGDFSIPVPSRRASDSKKAPTVSNW